MAETVKVRIPVLVYKDGYWNAFAHPNDTDADLVHAAYALGMYRPDTPQVHWLTADLPLPTEPEVAASVEGEGQ